MLERKTVEMQKGTLTVKSLQWDRKSVLVRGCQESEEGLEYLTLFLEDEFGPVEPPEVTDDGIRVSFEKPEGKSSANFYVLETFTFTILVFFYLHQCNLD